MVVVLMGVSGSGKSTVGKVLAEQLGWAFVEGDDFHPAANVEQMRAGTPLNDADRKPWLTTLRERLDTACAAGEDVVLACSALKHAYQDYLERNERECVCCAYLHSSEDLLRRRLAERKGHFMPPGLLHSQFEALEPPADALRVDVTPLPTSLRRRFGTSSVSDMPHNWGLEPHGRESLARLGFQPVNTSRLSSSLLGAPSNK